MLAAWAVENIPIPEAVLFGGKDSATRVRQQVAVKAMELPWSRRNKIKTGILSEMLYPKKANAMTKVAMMSMKRRLKVSMAGPEMIFNTSAVTANMLTTIPTTVADAPRWAAYLAIREFIICWARLMDALAKKTLTNRLFHILAGWSGIIFPSDNVHPPGDA